MQFDNQQNMAWTNNSKEIRTCIGITVYQEIKNNKKQSKIIEGSFHQMIVL